MILYNKVRFKIILFFERGRDFLRKDVCGKFYLKWGAWPLFFVFGCFLASGVSIAPAPFTIMCGGIVAALLSYLSMETGKESKSKEIEEMVFKDCESQYMKYLEISNEIVRECEVKKGFFSKVKDYKKSKENFYAIKKILSCLG